jgi:hypothetical protein
VPETDEAVRRDLYAKLAEVQQHVGEYLDTYSGMPELPPSATVAEMFEAMEEAAIPIVPILDSIEGAVSGLEEASDRALAASADIQVSNSVLEDYFHWYDVWLEAHRYQSQPDICRGSIPATADGDPIEEWAFEIGTCLSDYFGEPLIQDGLEAADELNSITPQLEEAWS